MNYQNNISRLHLLRKQISFLHLIPEPLYFSLQSSELYIPTGYVQQKREELEQRTGQYVMTYNRSVFDINAPIHTHLCANLRGAELSESQLQLLNHFESLASPDISFVIYKKPLQLQNYFNSNLYSLYKKFL